MKNIILVLTLLTMKIFSQENFDYASFAQDLSNKTALDIQKKHKNLYVSGLGSSLRDEVKMLGISFDYHGKITPNEARTILVETVELLSARVNESAELKRYLISYPFSADQIEVRIFITQPSTFQTKKFHYIGNVRGKIKYCNDVDRFEKPFLIETYEEALAKVQSTQNP